MAVADDLLAVYLYEQVCRNRTPFHWLYPELRHAALNTPRFEGIEDALRENLQTLVRSNRLVLTDWDEKQLPATSSLKDLQVQPFKCFVGLTKLGAAEWEAAASPRWDEFYDESSDDRMMTLASTDKSIILRLMQNRLGWSHAPLQDTVRWRELRPWKATYWKTLESAWEAEFQYESCRPPPHLPETEEERIAKEEWRRMTQWFTRACDLPGWRWRIQR